MIDIKNMRKIKTSFMHIIFHSIILAVIVLLCISNTAYASSDKQVEVTLPDFSVIVNNIEIDSNYRTYPILLYKNMAYFPMTYYDSRFMGVETKWNDKDGIIITKAGFPQVYHEYASSEINPGHMTAEIVSQNITVNGIKIDNNKEEYPILNFRNVPYIPLTERFCIDEFNWNYSYSVEDGIYISEKTESYQNETPVSSTYILPYMKKDDGSGVAFAMHNGYFYYEGENGEIYAAPVKDPMSANIIYQLPKTDTDGKTQYAKPVLRNTKSKVILSYVENQEDKEHKYTLIVDNKGAKKTLRKFKNKEINKVKIAGNIFYIDDLRQLRKKGEDEIINPGGIVKKMEVQEGYLLVTFDPDSASQYRTFVIGKSGNIIYKSTEETANVVIYDDKLMFIKQQM